MTHVLYIHGFLGSPESFKAQQVREWLAQHRPDIEYHCPFLTPYPGETQARLETYVESKIPEPVYLLGSSLGGFWATWLAEKYNLRAVLINPVVRPGFLNQSEYIGIELKNYHTEDTYQLNENHVNEFEQVVVESIQRPGNYWLMIQTGDEVLDHSLAIEYYKDSKQLVEEGGNHSFQDFQKWIPEIIEFLEMN